MNSPVIIHNNNNTTIYKAP